MKTISNSNRFLKAGYKVVYRIDPILHNEFVMTVKKKDNYFGRKNFRGGYASVFIGKNDFEKLTARDKIKIFQKLYFDAIYEATDENGVINSFELTFDSIRLHWRKTGVIVEFARDRSAA